MSNISKQIVSAILSENFYKAKELISEALNGKLGVLMEEKLISFGPTIHSPSNKLFEDDDGVMTPEEHKKRQEIQDKAYAELVAQGKQNDVLYKNYRPLVTTGEPILPPSTSFEQLANAVGGFVSATGVRLFQNPSLGSKIAGGALTLAGAIPTAWNVGSRVWDGSASSAGARKNASDFETKKTEDAKRNPAYTGYVDPQFIYSKTKDNVADDQATGKAWSQAAQDLLTWTTGFLSAKGGIKIADEIIVRKLNDKLTTEARRRIATATAKSPSPSTDSNLERIRQAETSQATRVGYDDPAQAPFTADEKRLLRLSGIVNKPAAADVGIPMTEPSSATVAIIRKAATNPLMYGVPPLLGSLTLPNIVADLAISQTDNRILTTNKDASILTHQLYTNEDFYNLQKLQTVAVSTSEREKTTREPGVTWLLDKKGNWVGADGTYMTQQKLNDQRKKLAESK